MKLQELYAGQKINVEILWGNQKLEYASEVVQKDDKGVYIKPYLYQDKPLEMNIDLSSGIICSIFANDENNNRVSWKNVDLVSVQLGKELVYYLTTRSFNNLSQADDRRKHERVVVHKKGQVHDPVTDTYADVIVHDISDIGISFYVSSKFQPATNRVCVIFDDYVDNRTFGLKVDCLITRTDAKAGNDFKGCRVDVENKDFLIYGFMKRIKQKS